MKVPFIDLTRQLDDCGEKITQAISSVITSGKYSLGDRVKEFEETFAKYCEVKYGVGVNSATDALKISLKALGIKSGDEVITVSNTAVPTVSAIREIGAIPVFVDIDEYFTIDVSKIEGVITKKTRAIVPVHLYGQMCDMDSILEIAKKHKLIVVEDCAQSTGALYKNKKAGSFGDAAIFSFYPTKNLGAIGDGGMIVTNNEAVANECKKLRMYGMEKTYYANIEGYNSRLDEMQAAILLAKLPFLDKWNKRRMEIAKYYKENINNALIKIPGIRKGAEHVYHLFVIRTPRRDELKKYLEENGVGSAIHYPFPIHLQKAYDFLGYKDGDFVETEKASQEILSLPIFPGMTSEEMASVVSVLNSFV